MLNSITEKRNPATNLNKRINKKGNIEQHRAAYNGETKKLRKGVVRKTRFETRKFFAPY